MNLKKLLTAGAVGLLLVGGMAGPANAETLHRHGAKTVTIKPAGAPKGAVVSSAKVTVKKGKKTVARNKSSYKAKKGTYKVTSTFIYRQRVTKRIPASDVFAQCRVSSRAITSDRTTREEWFDGDFYYAGQVTVRYTGSCTDQVWVGSQLRALTWQSSWSTDEFIMTDFLSPGDDVAAAKAAELSNRVGDVDYVSGSELTSLPTVQVLSGPKKATNTRTVVVR